MVITAEANGLTRPREVGPQVILLGRPVEEVRDSKSDDGVEHGDDRTRDVRGLERGLCVCRRQSLRSSREDGRKESEERKHGNLVRNREQVAVSSFPGRTSKAGV